MPSDHRLDRAQSLRGFLLSKALANHLDDDLLQDALALIKLPVKQLTATQLARDQLLDEWQAGAIDNNGFIAAWRRIAQDSRHDRRLKPEVKTGSNKAWIPYAIVSGLMMSALFAWIGHKFWQLNERESAVPNLPPVHASAAAPLAQEKTATLPCPACPDPLPPEQVISGVGGGHTADYPVRAYVAEGFSLADMAKVAVAEYFMTTGHYPDTNAQIGLPRPSDIRGNAVSSVAVGAGGMITVTYNQFVGQGKTLILRPLSSGGGPIMWDCKKGTVPSLYRPPHCH